MVEVGQLFITVDTLHGTQVDASQHDVRLFARLHISLQRRLAVELNGQVHHPSSFHQAIGRRVGPSTGDVDAHRTSSPHDLVAIY